MISRNWKHEHCTGKSDQSSINSLKVSIVLEGAAVSLAADFSDGVRVMQLLLSRRVRVISGVISSPNKISRNEGM